MDDGVRQWFGARRLVLKARYVGERVRVRIGKTFARERSTLSLDAIKRRLELVLAAAYGRPIAIAAIEEGGWTRRRLARLKRRAGQEESPTVDGETIRLPGRVAMSGDAEAAKNRYRLFAIEQAERITRGTLAHAGINDPLERDLYLLREAAAIDAKIARSFPGLLTTLEHERASALQRRPSERRMTPSERDVEHMLVTTLKSPPADADIASQDPSASLEWARRTASEIRRRGDRYRGVPLATAWGSVPDASGAAPAGYNPPQSLLPGPKPSSGSSESPSQNRSSQAEAADKDSKADASRPNKDGRRSDAGDPTDRNDDAPASKQNDDESGSQSSDSAPASAQARPDAAGQGRDTREDRTDDLPPAIYYDEWNGDKGVYLRSHTAVRVYRARVGNPAWLRDELQKHAATARQIRHQFERLRARRTLSVRQLRGDALDLSACVEAITARRMGTAADDRLYVDARPARRGIAISLLIDASGSTDRRVTEAWRIIDLEKIALLLATQALDALGDLYAIYAFAGRKSTNVKVTVVKDFAEANGDEVTRRIAAIVPDGFTRLGAAVRHATRELARQSAGHRLLLLLSDGRPNDIDEYQGPYGVEDSRQAIQEARASGVFPFCLTIDEAASEYLPRIFGRSGHVVLEKPEQLPTALLSVVRGLIKR